MHVFCMCAPVWVSDSQCASVYEGEEQERRERDQQTANTRERQQGRERRRREARSEQWRKGGWEPVPTRETESETYIERESR